MLISKNYQRIMLAAILVTGLLSSGCSESGPKELASGPTVTLSNDLEQIYTRSCKNCHTIAGTGAPLTGDHENWNKILQQGIDTVVDKAMSGVGGMPPAGQCFECSPEQIKKLILYMANPAI